MRQRLLCFHSGSSSSISTATLSVKAQGKQRQIDIAPPPRSSTTTTLQLFLHSVHHGTHSLHSSTDAEAALRFFNTHASTSTSSIPHHRPAEEQQFITAFLRQPTLTVNTLSSIIDRILTHIKAEHLVQTCTDAVLQLVRRLQPRITLPPSRTRRRRKQMRRRHTRSRARAALILSRHLRSLLLRLAHLICESKDGRAHAAAAHLLRSVTRLANIRASHASLLRNPNVWPRFHLPDEYTAQFRRYSILPRRRGRKREGFVPGALAPSIVRDVARALLHSSTSTRPAHRKQQQAQHDSLPIPDQDVTYVTKKSKIISFELARACVFAIHASCSSCISRTRNNGHSFASTHLTPFDYDACFRSLTNKAWRGSLDSDHLTRLGLALARLAREAEYRMEAWEKLRRTDERDHGATLAHGRARQQRSMERDAHLLHLYHEHLHWAHFETRPMQTNLRNLLPRSPPPASTYSSTLHNQDHSFQSEDNREESHEREQQLARLHKWDHAERQRRQFAKLRYGRNAAFRLVNKWGVLSLPVSASPEQQSDRLQDWFPAFFDTMQLALSHYPGDEKHRRLSSEMRERGGAQLALLRETMQLIMADRKYASADELVRFFEHDRDSITDEKVGDHRRRPSPMDRLRNDSDTLAQVIYELARRQEWDAVERIWYLSLRRRPPPALRGHQPGAMNDGIAVAYLSAQIERCQPPSSARIRDEARRRAGSPWRQIGSSEGRILLSHQRSTHLRRVLAEVWTQQPYASTSSDDLGAALPVRTVPLISSRFLGKIFHVASVFPHACGRAILGLWADLLPSALDDGINSSNDTRDPEKVALSSRVLASALDLVAWNTSSALSGAPTDENIEGSGSLLPWRRKTDGSSTGPGHISAQTMRHLFRSLLFAQHPHLASMRTTPLEEVLHAERRRVGSSVGDHEFVSAGRRGRVASFFRKVLLSATVGESWMSRLTTAGPDEDGAENDKIVFPIAPAAPYRRDDDPPSTSSGRFFDDNANDLAVSDGQESNMHHQPQRPYINFDAEVFEKYALLLHVMTMPQSSVTFQPFHGDGQGRSGGPTAIRQFRLALGSPAGPAGQDSERGTSTTSSSSSAAPSSNFDSLLIKDQREEGAAAAAASTPVHPDEVLLVLTWMRALGLSPSKNLLCLLSVHLIETLPPGLMSSSSTQRASPSPLGPLSEWVAEWEKHVGVGGERGKGVVTRLSDDDVGRWLGRIRRKRAGARGRSNANRSWAG